jgi:ABC-2 type transport system permease protein
MMLVMIAVFSQVFRYNTENYPIYLLTGQVVFAYFSEATNAAMFSIVNGGPLIKKVYIPKYILPIAKIAASSVQLTVSLIAVMIMLILTQSTIHWTLLLSPVLIVYVVIFTSGVGLILATAVVYFRDIVHLYSVFLTALMYFTAIFYPVTILPDLFQKLILLNPLYHYIKYLRMIVISGKIPTLSDNLACMAFSFAFLFLGLYVFRKYQDDFILHI